MQEAVLTFISNQFSSKDDLHELENAFRTMDTDGNGILSKDELLVGYTQLMGDKKIAEIEVEKILEKVDTNKNGEIDYSGKRFLLNIRLEFVMASVDKNKLLSEEKLKAAFNAFDLVNNPFLYSCNHRMETEKLLLMN